MTALYDNLAKLDRFLARFRADGIPNRIAGRDQAGAGGVFQSVSPVDKSVICEVAHGTDVDIDAAAEAAKAAFRNARDQNGENRDTPKDRIMHHEVFCPA